MMKDKRREEVKSGKKSEIGKELKEKEKEGVIEEREGG